MGRKDRDREEEGEKGRERGKPNVRDREINPEGDRERLSPNIPDKLEPELGRAVQS